MLIQSDDYREFSDLWDFITRKVNDEGQLDDLRCVFFNYTLLLAISLWGTLPAALKHRLRNATAKFYSIPLGQANAGIERLLPTVASVALLPKSQETPDDLTATPDGLTKLIEDMAECFTLSDFLPYDDGISLMPQFLGYPPDEAIALLKSRDFSKPMFGDLSKSSTE